MKASYRKSFERDLKKLRKDHQNLSRIRKAILGVEEAEELVAIPGFKKISGGSAEYYRIRVGDYRIGIEVSDDEVIFTRCLHRREIYRYFP